MPELVGSIYDAALNSSCWQTFLDAYVAAIKARCASAILNTRRHNRPTSFYCSNWPSREAHSPAKQRTLDDWHRTVANDRPEGAIWTIDVFDEPPAAAFGGGGLPGDFRYGLAAVFLRAPDGPSLLVSARSGQDGPFQPPAADLLRSLIPHLRRAALVERELSALRRRLALFSVYLDRHPYPFLLTDAHTRVVYANAAAAEIAALHDGLAITSGHLLLMSNGNQTSFLNALREVAAGQGAALYWLCAERPSRKPPYRLLLMPVPDSAEMASGFPAVASVLIIDTEPGPELDPTILRMLFGLTPTEARVTAKLGAGRSAEQIADEMGISLETVRTHIRRTLSKTGTGRQGELISLVLRTTPLGRL